MQHWHKHFSEGQEYMTNDAQPDQGHFIKTFSYLWSAEKDSEVSPFLLRQQRHGQCLKLVLISAKKISISRVITICETVRQVLM